MTLFSIFPHGQHSLKAYWLLFSSRSPWLMYTRTEKSHCYTQALITEDLKVNSILITFQSHVETGISPPSASLRAAREPRRWRDRPCWLWWDRGNCNEDWKKPQSHPNRCLSEGDGWLRSLQGCLKWMSLQSGKETAEILHSMPEAIIFHQCSWLLVFMFPDCS